MVAFRCLLGLHRWGYYQRERDITIRRCFRCGRREWAAYDMGFGFTTWRRLR